MIDLVSADEPGARDPVDPALPFVVTLDDGTPLRLRLGTPDDRAALVAGFERLSSESRVRRFFTGMPKLSPLFLDRLLDVDRERHVAIAAEDLSRPSDVDGTPGLGVGVGRYIRNDDDPSMAEMAVAVIDEYHGRGIGRILLDTLVDHALDHGITTFTASVMSTNTPMLSLLMSMGAHPQLDLDDPTITEVHIPVSRELVDRSRLQQMLRRVASDS